jgi:two-component system alkaline phosphatase synthesis response regulator PhoP
MNESILIIDNNSDFIDRTRDALEEFNYIVIEALDGSEGMRIIRSSKPDIILLDVKLPGQNGLEILKFVKSQSKLKDIKVAICTANSQNSVVQQAIELQADGYIVKPVPTESIVDKIRELIMKQDVERTFKLNEGSKVEIFRAHGTTKFTFFGFLGRENLFQFGKLVNEKLISMIKHEKIILDLQYIPFITKDQNLIFCAMINHILKNMPTKQMHFIAGVNINRLMRLNTDLLENHFIFEDEEQLNMFIKDPRKYRPPS